MNFSVVVAKNDAEVVVDAIALLIFSDGDEDDVNLCEVCARARDWFF